MRSLAHLGLMVFALSLMAIRSVFAWPLTYSAPEISARVVDEQTGAPLGGAVVNARWMLFTELMGGNSTYLHSIYEFETVTDKDGWFRIPAWGPQPRPPNSRFDIFVPQFRIFKSGYFGKRFSNERVVKSDETIVESDWNGKTMALRAFGGQDWKGYVRSIASVWSGSSVEDCRRSCPRMVLAVYAEWDRISPIMPPDIYRREIRPPAYPTLPAEDREFLEQFKSN